MINYIKRKVKDNKKLYDILGYIFFYLQFIYFKTFQYIFKIFPINNKKIMIISYYGKGYGDSGKYVCEELLKNKNIKIYWAYNSKINKETLPKSIYKVKFNSIKYLFHLTTSKIWINNTRFLYGITKRKSQVYIQLWHGGIALKKVEFDSSLIPKYVKTMIEDNKLVDIMVSNSKFCTEMYKKSFKFDGEIKEYGTPRNDKLINCHRNFYLEVREHFSYSNDTKILLYAPTFRTDYSEKPYDINFDKVKEILEEKTKNKWVIFVRMHPIASNYDITSNNEINSTIVDVTDYPDMQKLIGACDILITDYSSSMFEAMMIKKPVMLYAKDWETYKKERGFYFELDDLPFLVCYDSNKVKNEIFKWLKSNYCNEYDDFVKKIKLKESGNASKKVCQLIYNIIEMGEKGE